MTSAQQNIIKLVTGMFNASPGGYLAELSSSYSLNGGSLERLATDLGSTEAFKSLYPTYYNGTMFANTFLGNLLFEYNSSSPGTSYAWLRDLIATKYNAGEKAGKIIYDVLSALDSVSSTDTTWGKTKQLYDNRVTVSSYYAVDLGGGSTSLSTLQSMLTGVTNDVATASNAIAVISASSSVGSSGSSTLQYGSSATSATITLDNVGSSGDAKTLNIGSGSALATLQLLTSGTESYVKFTNSGLAPIATIKISGDKALNINLSDSNIAVAKTIDASSLAANMTLTMNDTLNKDFVITGSSKDDTIDMGRKLTSADSIDAKAGTNTLKVNFEATNATDSKLVNIQNITLTAACDLNLSGQTENFTVTGSSYVDSTTLGTDNITLGSGNDTINSGSGNDVIKGGDGSDVITTGDGLDVVVFEATYGANIIDTVKDFKYGYDKLDFSLFLASEDNETGVESIRTTSVALSAGLDLSVDGGDTDTVVNNVGVVTGATNGEISKVNIALSTAPDTPVAGKITLLDNAKAVVLSKASDTSSVCNVYFIEDKNTDEGQDWSVKLVGILESNSSYSADNMAQASNFY